MRNFSNAPQVWTFERKTKAKTTAAPKMKEPWRKFWRASSIVKSNIIERETDRAQAQMIAPATQRAVPILSFIIGCQSGSCGCKRIPYCSPMERAPLKPIRLPRRLVRDEGSPMHVFLFCRGHSP